MYYFFISSKLLALLLSFVLKTKDLSPTSTCAFVALLCSCLMCSQGESVVFHLSSFESMLLVLPV